VAKIQKLNYKGYQIDKKDERFYFAGQAFDNIEDAKKDIDEFLNIDWGGYDDGEEQRLFEEYWQSQNY